MKWEIDRLPEFERGFAKLSADAQKRCNKEIEGLANAEDPRQMGKPLVGRNGYPYRFGNYRMIYDIIYKLTLIELYDVGKRSRIYN